MFVLKSQNSVKPLTRFSGNFLILTRYEKLLVLFSHLLVACF